MDISAASAHPTPGLDLSLFQQTSHSPSYASLTQNFEHAGELHDYCIPVNSYFPPTRVMDALYRKLPYALKYYPSSNSDLAALVCAFVGLPDPACVIVGNGSTELISWLNTVFVQDDVLVPVPSFGRWTDEPQGLGRRVEYVAYSDAQQQHLSAAAFVQAVKDAGVRNAVLCNPNNPTGSLLGREDVIWIMQQLRHLDTLVIDESFIDFSLPEPPTVQDVVADYPNAWVLKSLGKNLGLHGLRMGYAISCPANIARLRRHLPYWNVNGITELLLKLVVEEKAAYEASRRRVLQDRDYLHRALQAVPELTVFPSFANFVYVRLDEAYDGEELRNRLLLNHRCFVRTCGNKVHGSSQYLRIAARPQPDVDYLVAALRYELRQAAAA
ncbi:histidinol-phosphate aminotransferase family protein [Hymenobacter gummosus]|uniref:Aminotransferase n=1 Tax=Hymenobacter gummosus TaxID=1776032 RepID=A0A431UA61_9BACT|nr:histidinol-phosphate transaminase [Hymenobacter gummosus]RTQ53716.1 histidinol-phosphate aminotransferase family protein [Hymenobacter gummosus]